MVTWISVSVKMPSKMMEGSVMAACDCYCCLSSWNQRAAELTEIADVVGLLEMSAKGIMLEDGL